ncbi:MAG TPA: type II secretion system secretin GspD [Polyangiaceae bacterium]|nr:type II secretion system secretin GspD [Polyangiaceae bacterium]
MKARSHRSFFPPRGPLAGSLLALTWLTSAVASAQDAAPAPAPAAPAPAAPGFEKATKAAERRKSLFEKVDVARGKKLTGKAGSAAPGAAAAPPPPPTTPAAAPVAAPAQDRDPPGAAPTPPSTMEKIAQATDVQFRAKPGGHLVKFNLQDADLAELVNHISGLTGKRFIYGAKVRQVKATVVSPEPVTLEEAYQAFLSILEANGMTVVPHGRFLKIVDSGGVVTQPTPIISRGEPVADADRYVTRLYRLQAVSTDEAVALVTKFKSKDGDVSAYSPGRLLIITDTGTQVRRMIRILEEVDVGGSGQRLWIEPVKNGSAPDMAKRVNELFELGAAPGQPGSAAAKASGLSKVIADEQTNSLIIVGTDDSYSKLLDLLKRLDSHTTDGGRVHVLPLQHAIADELAPTLSQMLGGGSGGGGKKGEAASAAGNAGGMFEGEVRVTPDKSTNSLIITSSNRDYATLRLVLDKLDRPRRQVFIEAVVMDLEVSDNMTLGVAFHGGNMVDTGDGQSLLLGGFQAGKSVAFPASPDLLQGLAAGMRGPDLAGTQNLIPGTTGLSIPAFGIALNALASSGKSNVLATPHIIATDNVAADIQVGQNIALQNNVGGGLANLAGLAGGAAGGLGALGGLGGLGALGGGFAAPRQDVGNKIKVTPHINESNQVRLEIDQESSSPGASEGALGAISINKRTANTTVVVADQQTVVLGGLMQDIYTTSRDKVPVLGDLPILGALFRTTKTLKKKTNLLLILTPHVIRDQADLRRIFERKMQERQEFLDRYFVFSGQEWSPPKDWSRTNGLVEEIRKSFREIEEDKENRRVAMGPEQVDRVPTEPLELPGTPKVGGTEAGGGARGRRTPVTPAPAAAPAGGAAPAPVPAPAPAAPPAPPPTGRNDSLDESPVRITPIARSVNVERVE